MIPNKERDRGCELWLDFIEGTLSPSDAPELNHLLTAYPDLRQDAAELAILDAQLRRLGREHPELFKVPEENAPVSILARVGRIISQAALIPRRQPVFASAVAVAGICLIGAALFLRSASMAAARIARLEGSASITRAGRQLRAKADLALRPGDRLELAPTAAVTIVYSKDGTWMRLSDAAVAYLGPTNNGSPGTRTVQLDHGTLSAVIAPQRVGAMRFATPLAEAAVLGTEFNLGVQPDSTRLEVWQGKVRFTRLADGTSVDVGKRQSAIIRAGNRAPLSSEPIALGVLREYWLNVNAPAPAILSDAAQFQQPADGAEPLNGFEARRDWADAFLARFSGLVRVPISGEYTFWVSGDDRAELWLSADETAGRKRRIAYTTTWTGEQTASEQSTPVYLEAGRSYYIEALQQELFGGDYLEVAWQPPHRAREVIPPESLSHPARLE